jgi:hypothetical protein
LVLAILLLPFVPVAIALMAAPVVVAAVVFVPPSYLPFVSEAPKLPSWAYPEGDVVERNTLCGGARSSGNCRLIWVGSDVAFSEIEGRLRTRFLEQGWEVVPVSRGNHLLAESPKQDVCVLYSGYDGRDADTAIPQMMGAPRDESVWSTYQTLVSVYVNDCSRG